MKFTPRLLFYTIGTIVIMTMFIASLTFILYHNGSPPNSNYWYATVSCILGLFISPPKNKDTTFLTPVDSTPQTPQTPQNTLHEEP